MSTIAERFKEVREQLGLSQIAMGAIGGVKKNTIINYEKGDSSPTADYLSALAKIGVDVLYLVTGQRMTATLEDEERVLLNYYRAAPEPIKKAAIGVLLSTQSHQSDKPIKARGSVQIASADNVVQIGGNQYQGDVSNEPKGRKRK